MKKSEEKVQAYVGVAGLFELLGEACPGLDAVVEKYPFRVTSYYAALADWTDPSDPIRLQVMPDRRELSDGALEGNEDPFDERGQTPVPGLVRRYRNRALVLASRHCAVNCRHCTRKNLLGDVAPADRSCFEQVLKYLNRERDIREVILSGGDPLLLDPALLDWLLGAVQAVDHVEVIRIGTRVPVTLPGRLDDGLADMMASHRPVWVNTQFNHTRELTGEARAACDRLTRRGVPVSNQTVLLRGVNDSLEELIALCNRLQTALVRPYYIFQCDPVAGTSHFRVPMDKAVSLAAGLRRELGGLAMPRVVMDTRGPDGKVPLEQAVAEGR